MRFIDFLSAASPLLFLLLFPADFLPKLTSCEPASGVQHGAGPADGRPGTLLLRFVLVWAWDKG